MNDGVDASSGSGPRPVLGANQLPVAGVERGDCVVDGDLHLTGRGRRGPGCRVNRTVTNHEQRPARRDTVRHPAHHFCHRSRHMDVQARYDVIVARLWDPGREIALDPVDALGDIRPDGLGG
ncbi:MAG: hypothetical protein QOG01_4004 [Pseudonocardiales bacterium]|nr:hypothetical protein [Pseudonocardiales bacterium]